MSPRGLAALSLALLALSLPLFASEEVVYTQDALVYNAPPFAQQRAAQMSDLVLAAPRLLDEHKHHIGPLSMIEQGMLHADAETNEKGVLRVGINRGMPQDVRLLDLPSDLEANSARSHRGGLLEKSLDGAMTWTTAISSEGAGAIRLNLRASGFPADSKAWVYSLGGEVHGPYDLATISTEGFWSNSVFDDEIYLEVRLGKGDARNAQLTISEIAHIEHPEFAPRAGTPRPVESTDDSCFVDAACMAANEWSNAANAANSVGAYLFDKSGSTYVCTGGLLADTTQTFTPYFLTANHCFTNQSSASSMEVFWRFKATSCGGAADPAAAPRTSGSTLLATNASSDFTLVRLNGNPPNGSIFLGWDTTDYTNKPGTKLYRMHHPGGAQMHYARHETTNVTGTPCGKSTTGFMFAWDKVGGTAGGSSGSPVMLSDLKVVGQLFGGCGPDVSNNCNRDNYNVDGAFKLTYNSIKQYIAPGGGGTGPCSATSSSFCTLSKRFEVKLAAKDPRSGKTDAGQVMFSSDFFGYFAFPVLAGNTTDPQVFIKVLDGRPVNGKFWVFYAALTDVEFTLTVRDTQTGATKSYHQNPYTQTSANDTNAF